MKQTISINHVLQTHGVLKKFNINKLITKKEISELSKKLDLKSSNSTKKQDILDSLKESMKYIGYSDIENIPGAKLNNINSPHIPEKSLVKLLEISNIFTQVLLMEKLTPRETSYVIGLIIKNLNLSDPSLFDDLDGADFDL